MKSPTQLSFYSLFSVRVVRQKIANIIGALRGGQKMNQNPKLQNFQVGGRNCGDTSLTELKNIWV